MRSVPKGFNMVFWNYVFAIDERQLKHFEVHHNDANSFIPIIEIIAFFKSTLQWNGNICSTFYHLPNIV